MDHKKKEEDYLNVRCSKCGKLLAKPNNDSGAFEIKCIRCGVINSIFKGLTDQIVITDAEGKILYVNPIIEALTGYELTEVLGKTPALWGGQMPKAFYDNMWHKIKVEKVPISVILTNRKKDGTLYKAELNISPVFGKERDIKMFVGIERVIKQKND